MSKRTFMLTIGNDWERFWHFSPDGESVTTGGHSRALGQAPQLKEPSAAAAVPPVATSRCTAETPTGSVSAGPHCTRTHVCALPSCPQAGERPHPPFRCASAAGHIRPHNGRAPRTASASPSARRPPIGILLSHVPPRLSGCPRIFLLSGGGWGEGDRGVRW
jgi:hypothetical protein